MNKKLLLAALIGGIAMWTLAGLWHEVILVRIYTIDTEVTMKGGIIVFLSYLILGILMTYFYSLIHKEGSPFNQGLKFGIMIGFLWYFPHELAMAGAYGNSVSFVITNAAWQLVEQAIGGVIIALIYGRGRAPWAQ